VSIVQFRLLFPDKKLVTAEKLVTDKKLVTEKKLVLDKKLVTAETLKHHHRLSVCSASSSALGGGARSPESPSSGN
jgi:hypothetical protein